MRVSVKRGGSAKEKKKFGGNKVLYENNLVLRGQAKSKGRGKLGGKKKKGTGSVNRWRGQGSRTLEATTNSGVPDERKKGRPSRNWPIERKNQS